MKKLFILLLTIVIAFGLFSCNNNKSDSVEYVYLPQTEVKEVRESHGFQQDYKYTYKYDSYGNVVKEQLFTKNPRGWLFSRDERIDTTYTYDDSGKILKELIRKEYFSTALTDSHSIYEQGFDYFYDENGRLSRKDYIQESGHSYTYDGFKYKYDDNGNLVKEIQYSADGTQRTQTWYKYDSDNVLIEHGGRQYVEHSYDDYGNLTYRSFRDTDGGYGATAYTYDKKNRLIKEVFVRYGPEGEKIEEITIEYSNFKKIALNK